MLDKVITERNKMINSIELLNEYLDYYIIASKSGVDKILTFQEYKRINKL